MILTLHRDMQQNASGHPDYWKVCIGHLADEKPDAGEVKELAGGNFKYSQIEICGGKTSNTLS